MPTPQYIKTSDITFKRVDPVPSTTKEVIYNMDQLVDQKETLTTQLEEVELEISEGRKLGVKTSPEVDLDKGGKHGPIGKDQPSALPEVSTE